MRHLLLTTAIVSLIAAVPVTAQSTDPAATGTTATTGGAFTPPEGYTQFEAAALTIEDLQGATVYDANGESVGEISDFVFDEGGATGSATGSTTGSTTGGMSGDTTGDMTGSSTDSNAVDTTTTTTTTTADTATGTDDTLTGTEGDSTATVTTDGTGTATGTETGTETDMATDSGTADGSAPTSTTTDTMADSGTDTTQSDTDGAITGTDTDVAATGNATDTTAGTGVDTEMAADGDIVGDTAGTDMTATEGTDMAAADAQQEVDVTSGSISHVVLDVGGFLGIGTHTVAVPLQELQVFRDEANSIRVYLPWTQAQLEAVPEFDENNPASLDAIDAVPAQGGATATE